MSRILVTGCSKGLGRATALELTRRGHAVIATSRKIESLASLPVAARLALDVRDAASVRRAAAEAGRVDVLVNNAGEIAVGPIESIPFEEIQKLYDVNVFGMLRTIQAFAPAMRERGSGTIVNVSSIVGRLALPLTRNLRLDQVGHRGPVGGAPDRARPFRREGRRRRAGTDQHRLARRAARSLRRPEPVREPGQGAPGSAARADDAARDHRPDHRRRGRGARAEVPLARRQGRRGDAGRPRSARRFILRRSAALGLWDRLVRRAEAGGSTMGRAGAHAPAPHRARPERDERTTMSGHG